MATLYLQVGTPADYALDFLRDLAGATSGNPGPEKSTLPPGVSVDAFGMTGTPSDLSTPPYALVLVDSYGNTVATLDIAEGEPTVPPLEVPLTVPTTELDAGIDYVVNILAAGPSQTAMSTVVGDVPPGMILVGYGETLEGIPTAGGDYPLSIEYADMFGDPLGDLVDVTVTVLAADLIIPAPAAEGTADGYMLPAVPGASWTVNGAPTEPGTYSVQPVTETTTVTIIPEPLDGYVFDPAAVPLVLTFEPAPEPGPWEPPARPAGDYPGPWPSPAPAAPSPEDEAIWSSLMDDDPQAVYVADRLAQRVIVHVGTRDTPDESDMDTARAHSMTVLEYVRGYTRGRGFVGYAPHRSLQAVIVAVASRLFTNPEQVTYYATGDYSERPATMTGWTAAELGVLRRFRKVFA